MQTVNTFYHLIIRKLTPLYGFGEAISISYLVLMHVLKCSKTDVILKGAEELSENDLSVLNSFLTDLLSGKPVQYVLGETEFCDLKFSLNEHVLIPRQETELLVNWLVDDSSLQKPKVLDIGTGSGCIAVSLKNKIPNAEVTGLDVSEKAIELAKHNAQINNMEVNFIQADILKVPELRQKFDIIVSNPPYVPQSDKDSLHKNVRDFEPPLALFVKDDNPLVFYDAIAKFALDHLIKPGNLFFEIYVKHAGALVKMLKAQGYENIIVAKDLADKDRMIKAELIN